MSAMFVFPAMLFMHVLDDYVLQGILSSMKQRSWWKSQSDDPRYARDYVAALLCHAYSWSFSTMLPVALYYGLDVGTPYVAVLFANFVIHAVVDDLKANQKKLNLVQDQLIHFIQICVTCVLMLHYF